MNTLSKPHINFEYTKVPNNIIRSKELKSTDKILYCYLLSKPDMYYLHNCNIANELNLSTSTISNSIKNLKIHNLLEINATSTVNVYQYNLYSKGHKTNIDKEKLINIPVIVENYTKVPNYLFQIKDINTSVKELLLVLLSLPSDCNINQSYLSSILNISRKTINIQLSKLKEQGLLIISSCITKGKNYYQYLITTKICMKAKKEKTKVSYGTSNRNKPKVTQKQIDFASKMKLDLNKILCKTSHEARNIIQKELSNLKQIPTKNQIEFAESIGIDEQLINTSNKRKLSKLIKKHLKNKQNLKGNCYVEPVWDRSDYSVPPSLTEINKVEQLLYGED